MSVRRGGSLENALLRASRAYRKTGRHVVLTKQEPRVSLESGVVGSAPVDFIGALQGGRALVLEAKAVTKGKSMPLSRLRDDQTTLMGLFATAGADVRLVVQFARFDEVYAVDYADVATFMATPYRGSFPLAWFRVKGLLLPQQGEDNEWKVWFLDGAPHPDRDKAVDELAKDQAKPRAERKEEEDEPEEEFAPISKKLTPEERMERVRQATAIGLKNARERAKRKKPLKFWQRRTRG